MRSFQISSPDAASCLYIGKLQKSQRNGKTSPTPSLVDNQLVFIVTHVDRVDRRM